MGSVSNPISYESFLRKRPLRTAALLTEGLSREALKQHPVYGRHLLDYPFQLGQPAEVRREFVEAMGLD